MGYTIEEIQRKIEKWSIIYVDDGILQGELDEKEMEMIERRLEYYKRLLDDYEKEQGEVLYTSGDETLGRMIEVDGIKNSIINLFGGVKEFVKDYGGDVFDEGKVEWFIRNEDYLHPKVEGFVNDWVRVFPCKN
jgi:hypothetical protein